MLNIGLLELSQRPILGSERYHSIIRATVCGKMQLLLIACAASRKSDKKIHRSTACYELQLIDSAATDFENDAQKIPVFNGGHFSKWPPAPNANDLS
jgi:hypothetical protein